MEKELGAIETGNLKLSSELDIKAAAPLTTELIGMRGSPIRVDGSSVERVGAQCLQVLLSAAASWRADGTEMELVEPSANLVDAIAAAGLVVEDFSAGID